MIFARKMPEVYIIIARKYFPRILGVFPSLYPPVSYGYGYITVFELVRPFDHRMMT